MCLTLTYFPKLLLSHFHSIHLKEQPFNFDDVFPHPGFRNYPNCNPGYPFSPRCSVGFMKGSNIPSWANQFSVVPSPVFSWKLILYLNLLLLMPASVGSMRHEVSSNTNTILPHLYSVLMKMEIKQMIPNRTEKPSEHFMVLGKKDLTKLEAHFYHLGNLDEFLVSLPSFVIGG